MMTLLVVGLVVLGLGYLLYGPSMMPHSVPVAAGQVGEVGEVGEEGYHNMSRQLGLNPVGETGDEMLSHEMGWYSQFESPLSE